MVLIAAVFGGSKGSCSSVIDFYYFLNAFRVELLVVVGGVGFNFGVVDELIGGFAEGLDLDGFY